MHKRKWKMLLSDKYEFLTNYFETCLKDDRATLSHSILLYGNDLESQFVLAKEIARLLNCTDGKSDECQCMNCKWIRENKHPAVMVISRVDNKPDGDNTKTTISVRQADMIRNQLSASSEFYRVFIFCDRDDDGKILGLNSMNFQEETANALLKIVEEPDERIMFIFLTQDKNNIIPTIVSRSQCFFVPSKEKINYDYDLVKEIFGNYWNISRSDAFDLSEKLVGLANEHGIDNILTRIQNYMVLLLKSNPKEMRIIEHIKLTERAKDMARLDMKSDIIFDDLCLGLLK